MFVPDLSNEPALTMVRMHNDLTRQVLVIRVIMINTLNLGSAFLFLKKNNRFRFLGAYRLLMGETHLITSTIPTTDDTTSTIEVNLRASYDCGRSYL